MASISGNKPTNIIKILLSLTVSASMYACGGGGGGGGTTPAPTSDKPAPGTSSRSEAPTQSPGNQASSPASSPAASVPPVLEAPSSPIISAPTTLTLTTNTEISIAGSCASGLLVTLSGDIVSGDIRIPAGSTSQVCLASAFSFTVNKTSSGSYAIAVSQYDSETGLSSPATNLSWSFDNVAPTAPVLTQPVGGISRSSDSQFTISGLCEIDSSLALTGHQTLNFPCSSGAFTHTFSSSTDGIYNWSIAQTDVAGNTSQAQSVQWTRDSSVPPTPVITTPSNNTNSATDSLSITGTCVTGYIVEISGDVILSELTSPAASNSQSCVNSQYSFSLRKTNPGT
jgi:hypothetical protein